MRMSDSGPIEQAFNAIRGAMILDPGYAWSWLCNLAVPIRDEIPDVTHEQSNRAAERLMQHIFRVSLVKLPQWQDFEEIWANSTRDESAPAEPLQAVQRRGFAEGYRAAIVDKCDKGTEIQVGEIERAWNKLQSDRLEQMLARGSTREEGEAREIYKVKSAAEYAEQTRDKGDPSDNALDRICANCRHFYNSSCTRFPPVPRQNVQDRAAFPRVDMQMRCGEWNRG